MPGEPKVDAFERLSDSDIARLRVAIGDRLPGQPSDFGATTVSEVAEASGLSEEEVREHLRRLRAESAFSAAPRPAPKSKRWILYVLPIPCVAVGWLYMVANRDVTEDGDPQAIAAASKMHAKPHPPGPITYLQDAKVLPPDGTQVQLENGDNRLIMDGANMMGQLNMQTGAHPIASAGPPPKEQLTACLTELAEAALTNPYFSDDTDYRFKIQHGGSEIVGTFPVRPHPGETQSDLKQRQANRLSGLRTVGPTADSERQQRVQLREMGVYPAPAGFGVSFSFGLEKNASTSGSRTIYESVEETRNDLVQCMMIHYTRPDGRMLNQVHMPGVDVKPTVMPAVTHITIHGPSANVDFDVPGSTSDQYPTASDAARARRALIEKYAALAAQQVANVGNGH